jgi:type IX secretion system PorP/SprF family membrane protein
MRKVVLNLAGLVLAMLFAALATAQQDPQFSQYFFNAYTYNPAYGGLDQALSVTAHGRAQWVGIEGNPFNQNVSAHSPVSLLHGGMGLQVLNQQEGAFRLTSATVSYAYQVKSRLGYFSIGVSGGVTQAAIDGSKLRAPDGDYLNTINHNDPLLSTGSVNNLGADGAAGIFFSSSRFHAGFAVNHLIPSTIKVNGTTAELNFELIPHYYFQTGYLAKLSSSLSLRPTLFLKSDGSHHQAEVDLCVGVKDLLWVGGGYRGFDELSQDAIIGVAAIRISEDLLVSYSYDFPVSAIKTASQGSHEVLINYRVNLLKPATPGKTIYNPRF